MLLRESNLVRSDRVFSFYLYIHPAGRGLLGGSGQTGSFPRKKVESLLLPKKLLLLLQQLGKCTFRAATRIA